MKKTRHRDSRGAALVEAAIVMVPLCLIIFGIIEFGFIFKDSLSISNASRSGARTASAEPKTASFFSDTVNAVVTAGTAAGFHTAPPDHLWIYRADPANGGFIGGSACGTDCTEYAWNGSTFVADGVGSGWNYNTQNVCLGGTIDSVGVKLQVAHKSITGFFGNLNNLKLTERTVMRLEPQASVTSC